MNVAWHALVEHLTRQWHESPMVVVLVVELLLFALALAVAVIGASCLPRSAEEGPQTAAPPQSGDHDWLYR